MCSYRVTAYFNKKIDCGPYGFVCERNNKLRLCEGENLRGPTFLCPPRTICNEESSDVCESVINYVEPPIRTIRCHRYERIADPNVPGCKGYILCIPNKNRFQGIKFKCTGNTVFNGYTRTCSASNSYRCPMSNTTKQFVDVIDGNTRRKPVAGDVAYSDLSPSLEKNRPIDCKHYKLTVTQDSSPVRAAYFCPPRPARKEVATRCTVFSNQFCLILERVDEDQFIQNSGVASRRPRIKAELE